MLQKFFTSNNKLNSNIMRTMSDLESFSFRAQSNTSTCDIKTSMYCVYKNISCKLCETCSTELNIENFVIGWKNNKRFCTTKCKATYNASLVDGECLDDYTKLLDKNGVPSSGRIDKLMNISTMKQLQETTKLNTTDITTLLYAALNDDFVPRGCNTCGVLLEVDNFKQGYRETQTTCSYECKDSNAVYKQSLSAGKFGVSRWESQKYVENKLVPWFAQKRNEILYQYNVFLDSTFEEYKENKKKLNFTCAVDSCGFKFTNDMSCNRSLFCKLCNPKSKQQTELTHFCINLGYDVSIDDRQVIAPKEIDIYIDKLKLGIEFDGFYWHDDKDDRAKNKMAKESGIRLIRVFEDEYKNKREIVLSRLSSILGKTENKIYARQCEVRELSSIESKSFFDTNHIQGNVNVSIKYGLYHKNILVSVMTFSIPRYDKTSEWELIRFASILNTSVVGGASKLFTHFLRTHKPTSIVSYCDLRYGTGVVYEKLGFKLSHQTESNYFYYKNGVRYSRVKFQKHKLKDLLEFFDPMKSETENMRENNYLKIHDSGNLVFKWNT